MACMDQKVRYMVRCRFLFDSGMCKAGIAVCVRLAMCSLCSRQARMLRIMSGMNQKDLFAHGFGQ